MCFGGGGGGGGGGNDWTYFYNIQRDENQRLAAEERLREQQAADAARAKFTTDSANAYNTGISRGTNYLSSLGLAPDDALVKSITDEIMGSVPDLDTNPAQYYTTQAYEAGLNNVQNAERTKYGRQVNDTFAPGFENNLLPDSSINSIIDQILGEQRGRAQTQIDANKARGVFNDTGYNAANDALTGQGTAARSTLQGIGNNILGTERDKLLQIRGDAGNAASSYLHGAAAPDIGSYFTRAQGDAAADLSGLEGSIRAALGTTQLFDPATALQQGGIGQGAINLTTAGNDVIPGNDKKKTQTGRGLGSTGVF